MRPRHLLALCAAATHCVVSGSNYGAAAVGSNSGAAAGGVRPPVDVANVSVASASLVPVKWDKAANWDTIERTARTAAANGAELVLLPEGFLEGYVIEDVCRHSLTFFDIL